MQPRADSEVGAANNAAVNRLSRFLEEGSSQQFPTPGGCLFGSLVALPGVTSFSATPSSPQDSCQEIRGSARLAWQWSDSTGPTDQWGAASPSSSSSRLFYWSLPGRSFRSTKLLWTTMGRVQSDFSNSPCKPQMAKTKRLREALANDQSALCLKKDPTSREICTGNI